MLEVKVFIDESIFFLFDGDFPGDLHLMESLSARTDLSEKFANSADVSGIASLSDITSTF